MNTPIIEQEGQDTPGPERNEFGPDDEIQSPHALEVEETEDPIAEAERMLRGGTSSTSSCSFGNIANDVAQELQRQEERATGAWKNVREGSAHQRLQSEYHRISPSGVVFFDVADQAKFFQETRRHLEELRSLHHIQTVERWDEKEMDRMFGKGLNPTSLITSLESAKWFVTELAAEDAPFVLEMGSGAGWSSVMLYQSLKEKSPNTPVKQFSIDMSAHAIAATQTLLEYSGVPYVTVSDSKELVQIQEWFKQTEEGRSFSGIVLVLDKFNDVLDHFPDRGIDGVYSSHGTAYLSRHEYEDLLAKLEGKLKVNGIFISDSLNPLYTNKLDTLLTVAQMLFPDIAQRYLTKRGIEYIEKEGTNIMSKSKYFQGEKVTVLKGFNTPHAYLIFRWCNYLIRNFMIGRFLDTKKSLEVTMQVVEDYRDDVFPSFLIRDILKARSSKFNELSNRPGFPIFMDTQGFRLTD